MSSSLKSLRLVDFLSHIMYPAGTLLSTISSGALLLKSRDTFIQHVYGGRNEK